VRENRFTARANPLWTRVHEDNLFRAEEAPEELPDAAKEAGLFLGRRLGCSRVGNWSCFGCGLCRVAGAVYTSGSSARGGAVLYADLSGNLDSCIAIRSMMAISGKGYMQAGGGIVTDTA
jgi:hypothetical protein